VAGGILPRVKLSCDSPKLRPGGADGQAEQAFGGLQDAGRIVLGMLRGEMACLAEVARRHGASETSVGKWKDAFIRAGRDGLAPRAAVGRGSGEEARLAAQVGELTRALGEAHVRPARHLDWLGRADGFCCLLRRSSAGWSCLMGGDRRVWAAGHRHQTRQTRPQTTVLRWRTT